MCPKYVKELYPYTQEQLKKLFETSDDVTEKLIRKLKEYNIIKQRSKTDDSQDISELAADEIFDVSTDGAYTWFTFSFVGILCINGIVLICCPKYIQNNSVSTEEVKQIVEVLKKYNAKEETIYMLNGSDDSSSFNLLAVMLYLLNDYYENGIYNNSMQIVIDNGTDEILWDRTINDTFAIIQNNRPYYTALKTRKTIDNDFDFFKRLHECVLTNISNELKDASLLDIFGYETVELSDEDIDDFGDTDYILYRIEQELNIQFNTHKQLVLKTLYAYLSNGKTLSDVDTFSLFGTNSFNLVWQDVCEEVLDNKLHTKLKDLPVPLNEKYNTEKNETLIGIIKKPQWVSYDDPNKPHEVSTLEPDCISIESGLFVISDAKYYNITLNEKEVKGQPGLESITKQYLYQLAYKDFISVHNLYVKNCFLAPTASGEVLNVGYVKMDMFSVLGLENIEVRLLPVKMMYEMYLGERKLEINELKL